MSEPPEVIMWVLKVIFLINILLDYTDFCYRIFEEAKKSVFIFIEAISKQITLSIAGRRRQWGTWEDLKLDYSVMQSDGNSFCGDVVSDSFKKASRDEDNILDQVYKGNRFGLLLWWFYFFITLYENAC